MTDSYTAELRDMIDRAYTERFGSRATASMVHTAVVVGDMPEHLADYLIGKGLRAEVGRYFREKNAEGLPKRPEVNEVGEHVQLEVLTLEEFGYVYDAYRGRAEANALQAEKIRAACMSAHDVDLALVEAAS